MPAEPIAFESAHVDPSLARLVRDVVADNSVWHWGVTSACQSIPRLTGDPLLDPEPALPAAGGRARARGRGPSVARGAHRRPGRGRGSGFSLTPVFGRGVPTEDRAQAKSLSPPPINPADLSPADNSVWHWGVTSACQSIPRLTGDPLLDAADEHAGVVPAEAHRVRERDVDLHRARLVRHVVEVAAPGRAAGS